MTKIISLERKIRESNMGKSLDIISDQAEHLRTCNCIVDAVNTIAVIQAEIDTWLDMQAKELMVSRETIASFLEAQRERRKHV